MVEFDVMIQYSSHLDKLIELHPEFTIFKDCNIEQSSLNEWIRNDKYSYDLQIMFIGKTGYGKSTILNSILNKNVFQTDNIESCTKILQCVDFKISEIQNTYISFADLPGLGESCNSDKIYIDWYKKMLKKSVLTVYLLRADQRDYVIDKRIFNELKLNKSNVIIALNFIDKIEPIPKERNQNKFLSNKQKLNLKKKIHQIAGDFQISLNNIVPVCALKKLYVKNLVKEICANLSESSFIQLGGENNQDIYADLDYIENFLID